MVQQNNGYVSIPSKKGIFHFFPIWYKLKQYLVWLVGEFGKLLTSMPWSSQPKFSSKINDKHSWLIIHPESAPFMVYNT